jgi:hypothetical protein
MLTQHPKPSNGPLSVWKLSTHKRGPNCPEFPKIGPYYLQFSLQ